MHGEESLQAGRRRCMNENQDQMEMEWKRSALLTCHDGRKDDTKTKGDSCQVGVRWCDRESRESRKGAA